MLVIDEIDALSKSGSSNLVFKNFLKVIIDRDFVNGFKEKRNLTKKIVKVPDQTYSLSVIGIANSVELFKGELAAGSKEGKKSNLLESNQLLKTNEVKLLFEPYTRNELQMILVNLYKQHVSSLDVNTDSLLKNLIHPQSFQLAASKIDKLSGDIRVCFEILRNAVQKKIEFIRPYLPSTLSTGRKIHSASKSIDNLGTLD